MPEGTPDVSVVVPVSERHDDMRQLYDLYADELKEMNKLFEFIFILDGNFPSAFAALQKLKEEGNPVRIVKFAKSFGESTALMEGFRQAKGSTILTLASCLQIDPKDLPKIFSAYDDGNDLIITRRYPRLRKIWDIHQSGTRNYATTLWSLLMFELWYREFMD